MKRIFARDGRSVVIAMDHAAGMRNIPGLKKPDAVVRAMIQGGADAILTSYGTAARFVDLVEEKGLIVSLDNRVDVSDYGVEHAIRLGADAVKVEAFPDSTTNPLTMSNLYRLGARCAQWRLTLMAEMIPVGFAAREEHTPENVMRAARMGAEAGADLVKVHYTGDPESFRTVIENCYVPALILGGPQMDSERDVLEMVAGSLEAGGSGVAIGRQIWQHRQPERMCAAVVAVVHGGASVDQALKELR
jgi:DhnA family fructose-bisphosphate aldolase class Ia